MKTAFLYAGQGAQTTGMGRDLYEKYPSFAAIYDAADRVKPGLKSIIFENKVGKYKSNWSILRDTNVID